jgi:CheY-like chemotaxis protein
LLVVDDDNFGREALGQLLEAAGYAVQHAANGREALRWLRRAPQPSLILLDLLMPEVNGWDFCEQQQRDPRLADIPVVVVSAAGPAAQPHGVVRHFEKPIAVDELLDTIRRYCARR